MKTNFVHRGLALAVLLLSSETSAFNRGGLPITLRLNSLVRSFQGPNDVEADATSTPTVASTGRRKALTGMLAIISPPISAAALLPTSTAAFEPIDSSPFVTPFVKVPLKYDGTSYLIYYRMGGVLFRANLDTGSPFLMVPGSCGELVKKKWGCYKSDIGSPAAGLGNTIEIYDGRQGEVQWRVAPFEFVNATGSQFLVEPVDRIFGVASNSLLGNPGGVFFGLVRDADARIRPSFLGQTPIRAFEVDLSSTPRTLTLLTKGQLIGGADYIPLVNDLRRRYKDPTGHYTALATLIKVNGNRLAHDGKPIYAIFDTGVTGMVVDEGLFEERYYYGMSE